MTIRNYSYNRFANDNETEELIINIINNIFNEVDNIIDKKWISTIDIPYATEISLYKLYSIVNLSMYPHDGIIKKDNQILEHFQPDNEPKPSSIDSWARGAVPTRHISTTEDPLFNLESKSDGTRTPSVSSMRSSTTGRSKSSHSSRALSRNGTTRSDYIHDNSPKIIELDESNSLGEGSGLNSTNHLYDLLQKQNNRLKKFTQVDDDTRDEFELLQEQLAKTTSDLRGKKYAVDPSGKAIGIIPIKSDLLPPYSFNPSHNITNYEKEKDKQSERNENKGKKGSSRKRGGNNNNSSNNNNNQDKDSLLNQQNLSSPSFPHFLPTASLATSLSSHTNIPLAPGVTLKSKEINPTDGNGKNNQTISSLSNPIVREGPNLPSDPKKLSRQEYFAKQQSISRMISLSSSQSILSDKIETSSPSLYLGESFSESTVSSKHLSTSAPSSRSQGLLQSTGSGVYTNRYLDINPLEGARDINQLKEIQEKERIEKERLERELEKDNNGNGNGNGNGTSRNTTNLNRGTVQIPHKPTNKQREIVGQLHGSQQLAGPRDRLSSYTLDSRRKVHYSDNVKGGDSLQELDSSIGGSVKKERADIVREIFRS